MPEFRTIEELVAFCDQHHKINMDCAMLPNMDIRTKAFFVGVGITYDFIADVLRRSNLGVVTPPADPSGTFRERVDQIAVTGPAEPADGQPGLEWEWIKPNLFPPARCCKGCGVKVVATEVGYQCPVCRKYSIER